MRVSTCRSRSRVPSWLIFGVIILAVGCSSVRVTVAPRVTPADLQKIKKVAVLFGASPNVQGNDKLLAAQQQFAASFGGGSPETFGDSLAVELLGAGFDVVERRELEKVMGEQALRLSGVTESEKIALGKVLAVDAILTGSVEGGMDYSMGVMGVGGGFKQGIKNASVKVLDVERGNLIMAMSTSHTEVKAVQDVAREIAEAFKKKVHEK